MTSMYPRVQFVDAPNAGATVIADLNEVATVDVRALHDEFSLGMASLAGDAGRRGRSWGKRRLQLPVRVTGSRDAALAAHRTLARAATRDGWMRFQLDAGTPAIWFRTYATQPEPVSFVRVASRSTKDIWAFTLPLDADPFGVGAEVTLGPFTVQNAPASGGMRVTLPAIGGDMPAPARVEISRNGGMIHGPAVAVSATPPAAFAAASWGAGVGAAVSSTGFIAGSYRPTTGALSSWTTVASFTPSGLPAGRWRLLTRLGGSSDAGAFAARWQISSGANVAYTEPVVVDVVTQARWVDLGQGPWPLADASALGVAHGSTLTLQVRRLEAGGELSFDNQLLMVPVGDEASLLCLALADANTANTVVLADAAERVALAVSSGTARPAPTVRGGWPLLRPGRPNTLTIFQNLDPTRLPGRSDAHGTSSTVTVKYRPQYLWGVG